MNTTKHPRIQEILSQVQGPSRYLGGEINAVRKSPESVRLKIALAFPDLYEIGTSHFGLQILYHLLNRQADIAAERVFSPQPDLEACLRSQGLPIFSLESHRPLGAFDIIGFSLLYELNYSNVLTLLDLAGIPFYARQRDPSHPLIIAGGPCTCNPEPMADFFDAMVIGDGEPVILEMSRIWMEVKAAGGSKTDILRRWSALAGLYIPAFFQPRYDGDGFQSLIPRFGDNAGVCRAILPDLDSAPICCEPVVPYGKPVHDRLRLEIARGCTGGCRFCQAGMIYRPVRERSPAGILEQADQALRATGYEDISLLSLSTGDYSAISPLMRALMGRYASEHVAVSLPSLRVGSLTPGLMAEIKKVRKTGFTLAPEAGSERLRTAINKQITEAEIFQTVQQAFELGWQVIKLYFMIGLPTETDADIDAMVDLCKRLARLRPKGKKHQINVSVGTFIPKPHTPFQWASQLSLEACRERLNGLRERIRGPGLQFKWHKPEISFLEGLFARGDRRLAPLLVNAYQKGCRFDGWSEWLRFDRWQAAFDEATDIDIRFFTTRKRDLNEPLPWDPIDMGVSKKFLQTEWHRAAQPVRTPDCRLGECAGCGVCDFKRIQPRLTSGEAMALSAEAPANPPTTDSQSPGELLELVYCKTDPAHFFGHLEMVNIFIRAIRRAGIPVRYSAGFHPMPKISFSDPLPIGTESKGERCWIQVSKGVDPESVKARLNQELPPGLALRSCGRVQKKTPGPERVRYEIALSRGRFDREKLARFQAAQHFSYQKTSAKGKVKELDLKALLSDLVLEGENRLRLQLHIRPGQAVRPADAVGAIFDLSPAALAGARIVKQREE